MHTVHSGFSIVSPIKDGKAETVSQFLKELNNDPGSNSQIPFSKSSTTHFVTGSVLPAQDYLKSTLPATLLFATSFSGPSKKHVEELIKIGRNGLCELFQNCKDFPYRAAVSDDELKQFMMRNRHWDTFYSGMQFITPLDIRREDELRLFIKDFIDNQSYEKPAKDISCKAIKNEIQKFVSENPDFEWAHKPWKKTFNDNLIFYFPLITTSIVALTLMASVVALFFSDNLIFKIGSSILGLIIISAIIIILKIRSYEKQNQFVAGRQPDDQVKKIMCSQNHPVINEMTVCSPLKEGGLRPLFFRLALRAVNLGRGSFGIPSVATARWMAVDKGRRMVFISNFSNLSESYVRDFIDNISSAKKINLLFGQGRGYPPTKWIMTGGSINNPNAFMDVVFLYQYVTNFWYCPHSHLNIDNININRKIRQGLFVDMNEVKSREWLQLL